MKQPDNNPVRSVAWNAISLVGGRWFLTLARFGIAALIVRFLGVERFGEYSLILSLLLVAEWFTDFGTTEIAVNAMSREPARERPLLSAVAAAKVVQVLAGAAILLSVLFLMGYPGTIIRSGLIAAAAIPFFGASLAYRTLFRARMVMQREVLAEIAGVVVMVPLVWVASARGMGLEILTGCFVVSRVVFFLTSVALARGSGLRPARAVRADVVWLLKTSIPLGIAGLLVSVYNAIDPIVLEKLADLRAVGEFSVAMRFLLPVIILVQALGTAFFPVLASSWQRDVERFRTTLQMNVNVAIVLAMGALCLFQCGSDALVWLMGAEATEAARVLRILSWVLCARAMVAPLSSLIIVSGWLRQLLWMTPLAIAVKVGLLVWLIPASGSSGASGAALAYLISEIAASVIPRILVAHFLIRCPVNWSVLLRVVPSAAAVIGVCSVTGTLGSAIGLLLATALYPLAVLLSGAVTRGQLRDLIAALRDRGKARIETDES